MGPLDALRHPGRLCRSLLPTRLISFRMGGLLSASSPDVSHLTPQQSHSLFHVHFYLPRRCRHPG
jgi:hypothetical protein